jgi:hypothetical protein
VTNHHNQPYLNLGLYKSSTSTPKYTYVSPPELIEVAEIDATVAISEPIPGLRKV